MTFSFQSSSTKYFITNVKVWRPLFQTITCSEELNYWHHAAVWGAFCFNTNVHSLSKHGIVGEWQAKHTPVVPVLGINAHKRLWSWWIPLQCCADTHFYNYWWEQTGSGITTLVLQVGEQTFPGTLGYYLGAVMPRTPKPKQGWGRLFWRRISDVEDVVLQHKRLNCSLNSEFLTLPNPLPPHPIPISSHFTVTPKSP